MCSPKLSCVCVKEKEKNAASAVAKVSWRQNSPVCVYACVREGRSEGGREGGSEERERVLYKMSSL
jgi:hypothetical protein